jgi:glycyl-tRNA synthetase beta chain
LATLEPSITAFFNRVMVMVDDENVRNNRLTLLRGIANDVKSFADFNRLVW